MKKDKCEIVRDLMPLVIDHAASESSCMLVEKHLIKCSECAAVYQQMGAFSSPTNDTHAQDQKMFRYLRRKRRLRRLPVILVVLLVGILLGVGGFYGWQYETTRLEQVMPLQQYTMTLAASENGDVLLLTYAAGDQVQNDLHFSSCVEGEKNVAYLWLTEANFPQKSTISSTSCYSVASLFCVAGDQQTPSVLGKDSQAAAFLSFGATRGFSLQFGNLPTTDAAAYLAAGTAPIMDDATPTDLATATDVATATDITEDSSVSAAVVEYDEIRQGTPASYVTLWNKGDALPQCSNTLADYFQSESVPASSVEYLFDHETMDPTTIPELQ